MNVLCHHAMNMPAFPSMTGLLEVRNGLLILFLERMKIQQQCPDILFHVAIGNNLSKTRYGCRDYRTYAELSFGMSSIFRIELNFLSSGSFFLDWRQHYREFLTICILVCGTVRV